MCVTPRHIVGRRYDTGREKGCSLIEDLALLSFFFFTTSANTLFKRV